MQAQLCDKDNPTITYILIQQKQHSAFGINTNSLFDILLKKTYIHMNSTIHVKQYMYIKPHVYI